MRIIVKLSEALPCVKSPISRTAGAIYVVTCVENVLVRTSGKEKWKESEMAGVETTNGCQVLGESDGKRVGKGWRVCRESDVRLHKVEAVGLGTGQDKSSRAERIGEGWCGNDKGMESESRE